MVYIVAATVLFGLLAAVNLLLTVGVVRRLREHTAELAALRRGPSGNDVALPVDAEVAGFTATAIDGRPVTLDALGSHPLVGFFSPHCAPCEESLPAFIEHAAGRPGGRNGVLAVVVGGTEETAEVAEQLRAVATVVVEPDGGPAQQAFAVLGFPAFVLLDRGVVAASNYDLTPVVERDTVALPAAR